MGCNTSKETIQPIDDTKSKNLENGEVKNNEEEVDGEILENL